MPFCTDCGTKNGDRARFCEKCGKPLFDIPLEPTSRNTSLEKRIVHDGEIRKCPSCGEVLGSFVVTCPSCGYELRGTKQNRTVQDFQAGLDAIEAEKMRIGQPAGTGFFNQIANAVNYKNNQLKCAEIDKRIIQYIQTYPIPNTYEDVMEFMLLAASNIKKMHDINSENERELVEAWQSKVKQLYDKSRVLFTDAQKQQTMEELYEKVFHTKAKQKAKKIVAIVCAAVAVALAVSLPFMIIAGKKSRLEKIEKSINLSISSGDYDSAMQYINTLTASGSDKETYDAKKEAYRALVSSMMASSARVPTINFTDQQYSNAVTAFTKAGFTNIQLIEVHDLITGWIHKEGEIIEISINGDVNYRKGVYIEPDAVIEIKYHCY